MRQYIVNNQWISLLEIEEILAQHTELVLGSDARNAIVRCREYLDVTIGGSDRIVYGVNTGFGSLCNTTVDNDSLGQLQRNLVISHACGMGDEVPQHLVKRMLLLKILGLSHGNSGVQLVTVERLITFFNQNILPVVYQQGSLGASGDLAPLAHLSLPLIGEGEVWFQGKKHPSVDVLKAMGVEAIELRSKEGLALLNGTQFMSTYASYAVGKAHQLLNNWITVAGLSLDAYNGRSEPFQENVNTIRNQQGQIQTAEAFRNVFEGSEIIRQSKAHVQDPYSFRCIPQVHGASKDAIDYCSTIVEREVNAVTDNPTVFPEEEDIVSAGNFHGQPLAITMDFLAIAMAELGSISERRVYKLISGTRNLPPFLAENAGLNSGFMIVQYTAASIVSQNKQYCTPASIDSIDSSNGQEDHVSMGANAATKLYKVIDNCMSLQGIELLTAAQAIEFRRPLKSSVPIEALLTDFRTIVPYISKDEYMHPMMQKSVQFIHHLNEVHGTKRSK
jgi:histidine ammonia-lyase